MTHRAISMEDLRAVPEAYKVFMEGSHQDFMDLLYSIGFDTKKDIEVETVFHRPMVHSREVACPRWIGEERSDPEWMASPYCTLENKLVQIGKKDVTFQKELVEMGTFPNYTAMFVDHIKDNTKTKSRKTNKTGEQ